jgi:hypothetical protein
LAKVRLRGTCLNGQFDIPFADWLAMPSGGVERGIHGVAAPANSREMGHSAAASSTIEANAPSSSPGTSARTRSADDVTVGRPSTSSRDTVARTSRRRAVASCSPSRSARAIEKHDAWAAAASSSGLVMPSGCRVRAAQVTGRPSSAPLPDVTVPRPAARSPFQRVVAVRSAIAVR